MRDKTCERAKQKSIKILSSGTIYIKKLLSIKYILKKLPSSGVKNYIKILQRQCCRKTMEKDGKRCKMEKDKIVLGKVPPVRYL